MNAISSPATIQAISGAIAKSDFTGAYKDAEAAIARGEVHPTLYAARALWFERQHRDSDALVEFEISVSLDAKNWAIQNAMGLCLTRLNRLDEALVTFDEAIRTNPGFAPSYRRKAAILERMGRLSSARTEYLLSLQLDPNDVETLGHLAMIEIRSGNNGLAKQLSERAFAVDPKSNTARLAQAMMAIAGRDFMAAEGAARTVLESRDLNPGARVVANGLLADALDGQKRTDEAFAAYSAEKGLLRDQNSGRFHGLRSATDHTSEIANSLQILPAVPPAAQKADTGTKGHVFILGFYRSGTTLLRRILEAHPRVVTLEEQDFLLKPARTYLSDAAGLAALTALSDEKIAEERAQYWKNVRDAGVQFGGKILVDKQPLNTIKLPLIARLFPTAKIILTVRDPRDVVLSCFRTHFEINAAMYDLLTVEGSARFYSAAMNLVENMRPALADRFLVHHYEDLISDFDGTMSRVCEFLELKPVPQLRRFASLKGAKEIASQSGMQVTRDIHPESVGKWKNYREHLAPVLPELNKWAAHWGYPIE